MIDWDKPIRQKNGKPARYLGLLAGETDYPRVVAFTHGSDDYEHLDRFTEAGKTYADLDSCRDLENIPVRHVSYHNCYPRGIIGCSWSSIQVARNNGDSDSMGIVQMSWNEDGTDLRVEVVKE